MKKFEKQLEQAMPFGAAVLVLAAATWEPVMTAGIAVICLVGIGGYYYFLKK